MTNADLQTLATDASEATWNYMVTILYDSGTFLFFVAIMIVVGVVSLAIGALRSVFRM